MKKLTIPAALLFVLMAHTPTQADEPDYRFTVPVTATNLHDDVSRVRVFCSVKRQSGPTIAQKTSDWVMVNDTNRENFTHQFVLEMNANQGINPAQANHYLCTIQLNVNGNVVEPVETMNSPQGEAALHVGSSGSYRHGGTMPH